MIADREDALALRVAKLAALKAWDNIKQYYGGSFTIHQKKDGPATTADRVADRVISETLQAVFPKSEYGYLTEESNVLEFGCGTGSTALIHAPKVKHLLAIDFSKRMIDIAKRKASGSQGSNVEFRNTTLFDLTEDNESFDVVLALNVCLDRNKVRAPVGEE